jgi:ubiquinone/menaquinone biosynthesis C-methylase UbiE
MTGDSRVKFEECIEKRLTGRHKKCFEFAGGKEWLKDKIILDIGCSFGWFEKYAVESHCSEIIGLEPDKKDFASAKKDVPEAVYKEGSALKIPFPDNYFNIVTLFDVIEHLPKGMEDKAITEVVRVLKHKGQILLTTPNKSFFSNILDPAWYFGHKHYSPDDIIRVLKEKNIQVVQVEKSGGWYELFGMILLYIFKWFFGQEIPFKRWFDMKREEEYLTKGGFVTLFVKGIMEK